MFKENQNTNPLADLISDETYHLLNSEGLLSEKSLRDYEIRRKFKLFRSQNIGASNAIELLRDDYPYLQFDTIRKIVYHIK